MSKESARILGFWIPTSVIVIALHLKEMATIGEFVDGFVSSLVFTLIFAAGFLMKRTQSESSTNMQLLQGATLGVLSWSALWLFWSFPGIDGNHSIQGLAFVINCAVMLVFGFYSNAILKPLKKITAKA